MDVTLVAVQPDGSTRPVRMKRARLTVGRKAECDIRIPVSSVSREHCEIVIEEGKLRVRDLGSSNGTYVNRERVQESELGPGSMLGIGPAVFVVKIDGNPATIDGKAALASGKAPEPVAAAPAPKARPSAPAGAKAPGRAAPKPAPAKDDEDDLDTADLDDSSVSDFDFDLLDDDDEKQPKL